MNSTTIRLLPVLLLGLVLGGCLQTGRETAAATAADDDAFCQKNAGLPGSPPYVACMKDRDHAASQRQARMDRTHRRVAEDMLNPR